jgi:hypothetical protein
MKIEKSHHVDAGPSDANGRFEWRYEYDLYRFIDEPLTLVARSYSSEADSVHFLRLEQEATSRGIARDDLKLPIFHQATVYLRTAGASRVEWLAESGYEPLPLDA